MVDVRTQLTTLAIEDLENGDFIMATRLLSTAIRLNPNNPELYFDRSICHYKLGDHQASLDDVNAAIRLNSTDYNIHYQKGLALLGLGLVNEGIRSFKKAIELRAIQDDSKLSHIFYLLRDAVKEVDAAKARLGLNKNQRPTGKAVVQANQGPDMVMANDAQAHLGNHHHHHHSHQVGVSNTDPVDSTTDRTPISLLMEPGTSSFNNHRGMSSVESCVIKNGNNNLVAPKRNNNSNIIVSNNNNNNNNNNNTNINNNQPVQAPLINGTGGSSNSSNCIGIPNVTHQNRVSSSAGHINSNLNINSRHMSSLQMTATASAVNVLPGMPGIILNSSNVNPASNIDLIANPEEQVDESKAAQFAWNIRRSERIFLHHSSEPSPAGASTSAATVQHALIQQQQSIPLNAIPHGLSKKSLSINSSETKGPNKRSHDSLNEAPQQAYQNQTVRSKDGASSIVESEIDVDDSSTHLTGLSSNFNLNEANVSKRVMIAPSSSMPATSLTPSTSSASSATTKDDSYSSKYKRLRRDRERARRGTSKLCTIKLSDLEELHKSSETSSKRLMRVIAPIDGWLYSGQLSVDESLGNNGTPQYVVKLDGDATGSSYLFSQETVLNDVIKEVRVKTVSELRKGARICCYWSRQYKCLSTGVVTSRTFEATKSLVSVKYDNGDLSALPLEDLRLLPPDYPKYMSNCDPLLLARNADATVHQTNTTTTAAAYPVKSTANNHQNGGRIVIVENKVLQAAQKSPASSQLPPPSSLDTPSTKSINNVNLANESKFAFVNLADKSQPTVANTKVLCQKDSIQEPSVSPEERSLEVDESYVAEQIVDEECQVETDTKQGIMEGSRIIDDDEDETIPPTDETIDFITSESDPKLEIDEDLHNDDDDAKTDEDPTLADQVPGVINVTKDNLNLVVGVDDSPKQDNTNSRASSEENNYGVTYCPWSFVGPPKRNKKHGRAYRDYYTSIRRGNEEIKVGDSAELMPRDESILPFIAKIDGFWATARGEMRVRVRWYYRLVETEGEPYEMPDGENALFETDHLDENDVQSIYRSTKILSWTNYSKDNLGHVNKSNSNTPKIFYLAGYYDPVRRIKHLRSDIKKAL